MSSITPTSASTGVTGTGTGTTGGKNTIADGVIEKVAGIAARQVRGVHDLGNGAARAVGAIRNVIGQQDRGQGISVEVGETQVAVDVTLIAEYPVDLQQVADDVRSAITDAIDQVVGMEVTEVNVTITDVNLPSSTSSDDDAAEKRVQ
ncbi:Asp23/Gls24 family envelope stress response protein [Clavibacter nebraskensis]|uniref:Asp23/Gls24 family envelope stress response protein n=2 Tax=Clavibacter nebraskensis TaxID=31963 RepID=A0A399PL58_9MICO|nr:Asp23/Gls24 family envelope stress response protein [Clavibacter nebraskensis]KXU21971.1 alkaline-shock protein [Clavibacter nebraskensis]OAH18771.1 alkaline-shock protein [Clavibacter nebraskensis]QGV65649.1 Asp23/Gls24 family envelope stress response protein [Clavibacter nebraskensis]QGV68445.1 Asp23/Gls24 family envelope stress response protein [Clavibacter nebraskensis]QGV71236.1 Asp23/Gls24 family envelope stress response protein [Clavibacter nebraskensis]